MSLHEVYQEVLDAPYYRRVSIGKEQVRILSQYIKNYISFSELEWDKESATLIALIGALRRFIGADGVFDRYEHEFLNSIFETSFDYDKMLGLLNTDVLSSYQADNAFGEFFDDAPANIRHSFAILGLLICVSDGELTVEEQRRIEQLLY